jgi:hypothetical protein
MSQSLSQEKRQEWKNIIHRQEESGMSIKSWCCKNGICLHKFYYWKKHLLPEVLNRACFTELTDQKSPGIIIECKGIRIYLNRDFDSLTLQQCLSVLGERC